MPILGLYTQRDVDALVHDVLRRDFETRERENKLTPPALVSFISRNGSKYVSDKVRSIASEISRSPRDGGFKANLFVREIQKHYEEQYAVLSMLYEQLANNNSLVAEVRELIELVKTLRELEEKCPKS